jgi:hypothetical protein
MRFACSTRSRSFIFDKQLDVKNGGNIMELHDIGGSEGNDLGPKPGDGGVIHHNSGEADFDGLPGDVLPPRKVPEKDQPAPTTEQAAD